MKIKLKNITKKGSKRKEKLKELKDLKELKEFAPKSQKKKIND